MELYRHAVAERGFVTAAELSAHVEKKHGVKIEPAFSARLEAAPGRF